jgi:hypothetical protein
MPWFNLNILRVNLNIPRFNLNITWPIGISSTPQPETSRFSNPALLKIITGAIFPSCLLILFVTSLCCPESARSYLPTFHTLLCSKSSIHFIYFLCPTPCLHHGTCMSSLLIRPQSTVPCLIAFINLTHPSSSPILVFPS